MNIKKLNDLVKKMMYILNNKQIFLCVVVLLFTIIGAGLECLGVSIVVPLVNVIMSPESLMKNRILDDTSIATDWGYSGVVVCIVGTVVVVYLLKNLFFIFLSWFRIKFACKIQREISIHMMESYMSRGYQFFLNTNYGELSRGVVGDVSSVYQVLSAGFRFLSDSLAIFLISIYMIYTDLLLSVAVVIMSICCILLIYFVFRKNMKIAGEDFRKYNAKAGQAMYQAFQGIKDVLVLRKQRFFVKEYEQNTIKLQNAQCKSTIGAEAPAYIIEGLCISGIMLIVAYKTIVGSDSTEVFVSTLAAFAIGAFRILPSLGRISISVNQVLANTPSINAVYNDIVEAEEYKKNHPEMEFSNIKHVDEKVVNKDFSDSVSLVDVKFKYNDDGCNVLDGINLNIMRGTSIGIKGTSGAGKSTLVDVLLGLLVPQEGTVLVDGKKITEEPEYWSGIIGYVSQSIFLCDGSIRENVAFGCADNDINDEEIMVALERAKMREFVEALPDGINTYVGDRGIRLSGGQRQRIAIARALYRDPKILIMDEATSALDNDTEKAIMEAIDSLQGSITMIIVAHRLTTIKNCDIIYEVSNGKIKTVKDILN